jgi:surface protein
MFENCTSLTSIDVSNWDVSNVTYMSGMFGRCTSLTSIDVSNWDVFNVTYMSGMFGRCTSLTSIDVSNWDVSNVTYIDNMFVNCTSLTTIDGWSSLSPNLQDNVDFGANLAKYTPGGAAEAGRTLLTDAVVDGGHAWSITDAGPTA